MFLHHTHLTSHRPEHRREMQQTLSDEKEYIRAAVQEVCAKNGRRDLDITVLQSQRDVDRARTEHLEVTVSVLEVTHSTLLNNVRRLERDIEDLSETCPLAMSADVGLDIVVANQRTLAEETSDADWTDQTSSEQSEADVASLFDPDESSPLLPAISLHPSSDVESSTFPVEPSTCPVLRPPLSRATSPLTALALATDALNFTWAGPLYSSHHPSFIIPSIFLVALLYFACCLLFSVTLLLVAGRVFSTTDNRPVWEKARMI